MTDKPSGSSEHSSGQSMGLANGSNPSMTLTNVRPTQRRTENATAIASANQRAQNHATAASEGLSSQLPVVLPQLQRKVTAAPPGTPKAPSTPAVAGMVRQTEFPN